MPVTDTWTEVDRIGLDILACCADGEERTIDRIDVRQPSAVISVAVEQLLIAGRLHKRVGVTRTTYTITDAGRAHLAAAKVA